MVHIALSRWFPSTSNRWRHLRNMLETLQSLDSPLNAQVLDHALPTEGPDF